MTPGPATPTGISPKTARARPVWVSVEGVNGVGKTQLAAAAAQVLGSACQPLIELPDSQPGDLPGRVIAALRATGDLFLRTGHPCTETLLLAALMVHRHEQTFRRATQVVLEDRGVHSVAAYQALILTGDDDHAHTLARRILRTVADWRPLPDAVVLLRDDPATCLSRFTRRIGRPAFPDARRLMARADHLYTRLAADDPDRFTLIDRRHTGDQAAVDAIAAQCRRAAATTEETPCVP